MALQYLFTADLYPGDQRGRYATADVSLERGSFEQIVTATLEVNPGGDEAPLGVELTEETARGLRDALDVLLGETGRVLPPF
jgi:hypothetical protein